MQVVQIVSWITESLLSWLKFLSYWYKSVQHFQGNTQSSITPDFYISKPLGSVGPTIRWPEFQQSNVAETNIVHRFTTRSIDETHGTNLNFRGLWYWCIYARSNLPIQFIPCRKKCLFSSYLWWVLKWLMRFHDKSCCKEVGYTKPRNQFKLSFARIWAVRRANALQV